MNTQPFKTAIALFGATGDLSNRKLLPSLFHLFQEGSLKDNFVIIAVGRRDFSDEDFRETAEQSINSNKKLENLDGLGSFLQHVFYVKLDIADVDTYGILKDRFEELEAKFDTGNNRLFYLAMPPQYFTVITDNLRESGVTDTKDRKEHTSELQSRGHIVCRLLLENKRS